MSVQTTSGIQGINGDLNVSGTLNCPVINATSKIQINGSDITSALQGVASAEAQIASWVGGNAIPHATLADTSTLASTITTAVGTSSDGNIPVALSTAVSGSSSIHTSGNITYNMATATLNVYGIHNTGFCNVDGTLSAGQINSGLINANGGIVIQSGQTLNGISTTTLGYVDPTSSIQTQLNSKVDTSSTQTIGGTKTFSNVVTFNNGINVTGTDNETGNLIVSGSVTSSSLTTNGNATIGKSDQSSTTILNGTTVFENLPAYQVDTGIQYFRNAMGSAITLSGNYTYPTSSIYEWNFINTTATNSPILTLPSPSGNLLGCEIKLLRDPASAANPLVLTIASGSFIISSTKVSPNFTLGGSWYKLFLVCLQVPGTPLNYAWFQTYYQ